MELRPVAADWWTYLGLFMSRAGQHVSRLAFRPGNGHCDRGRLFGCGACVSRGNTCALSATRLPRSLALAARLYIGLPSPRYCLKCCQPRSLIGTKGAIQSYRRSPPTKGHPCTRSERYCRVDWLLHAPETMWRELARQLCVLQCG